jgi:hypothetical protein
MVMSPRWLGALRSLGLDRLLPRQPERLAKLALALIVTRVIEPAAKLSTARRLSEATAAHSLGAVLVLYYVTSSYLEGRCCRFAQVYPAGLADDPLAGENPMALKVYTFIAEH